LQFTLSQSSKSGIDKDLRKQYIDSCIERVSNRNKIKITRYLARCGFFIFSDYPRKRVPSNRQIGESPRRRDLNGDDKHSPPPGHNRSNQGDDYAYRYQKFSGCTGGSEIIILPVQPLFFVGGCMIDSYVTADILAVLISRRYHRTRGAAYVSTGNVPQFDIKFSDNSTLEIKLDVTAASSNNAAVEYFDARRGTYSGILGTSATHWLHCIPDGSAITCYEIETKKLLQLCIESDALCINGGDGRASKIKLLPLALLKNNASDIFTVNNEVIEHLRYW
jgi:hypothetical protein